MSANALYLTRSNLAGWTDNTTFVQAPLSVAKNHNLILAVREGTEVPEVLSSRCRIFRFRYLYDVRQELESNKSVTKIFTGFDFPCMWVAWKLQKLLGLRWTVFLWDPPCLSHRDGFPPLRWAIDLVFRWFARRCDKLILNIHPGLLDEIGFRRVEVEKWRASGKLELRMQDAFDGLVPSPISTTTTFDYDFGVLSNWTAAKGASLMTEVMRQMPDKTCLWIGDPPHSDTQTFEHSNISFAGRLDQVEAFEKLKKCRILVAPYLNVRSLKWNYVLKLFEYVQLGRPILASDNPGNVEVAKRFPDRITLFRSGDVTDFVAKCEGIYGIFHQ